MNTVNPDQSLLKVLGRGAAPAETLHALNSVGSAAVESFQPTPGEVFSQANASQLAKVLRDNPQNRNDPMLTDSMFAGIENQSIVAKIGQNNVDPAGTLEPERMGSIEPSKLEQALADAGLKVPPEFKISKDIPNQQITNTSNPKSNINFNA